MKLCDSCGLVLVEDDDAMCPECVRKLFSSLFPDDTGASDDPHGIQIEEDPPLSDRAPEVEPSRAKKEACEPEPKRFRRDSLKGRKHLVNLIQPSSLKLGVVTWNVAHFGAGPLALVAALTKVQSEADGFKNQWQHKGRWKVQAFARKFVDYLDSYEIWEYRLSLALKAKRNLATSIQAPRAKLTSAEEQNRRLPDEKPVQEEEIEDTDDDKAAEKKAEEDNSDDPLELGRALAARWDTYDARHRRGAWADQDDLVEEWTEYFQMAIDRYAEVRKSFELQWKQLLEEEDETDAQDALVASMSEMIPAMKDLRAAAKMVVKPLLQLRKRANLADKVQKAAEKATTRAKAEVKEEIATARKALDDARKASRWFLGPLFTSVESLDKMTHRVLVAAHVALMFKHNAWLDAVVLQEVNKGIDVLQEYLRRRGCLCVAGFELKSVSGKGSQTEYYPLVVREGGRIDPRGLLAIFNDSGVVEEEERVLSSPQLTWNKSQDLYRPILAYDVMVYDTWGHSEAVRIGVVHTSPGGSEMIRPFVFDQVDVPLAKLAASSLPVVVGGDYYLTEEAVTVNWSSLSTQAQEEADALRQEYAQQTRAKLKKVEDALKPLETPPPANAKKRKRVREEALNEGDEAPPDERKLKLQGERRALLRLLESLGSDRVQLIRNDGRFAMSVRHRIQALGLELAQPLSGTNWKTKSVLTWFDAQVADFFVHTGPKSLEENSRWTSARAGLLSPTGGLKVTDAEDLSLSKYWRCASDHFPVGVMLSKSWHTTEVDAPFTGLGVQRTWGVDITSPKQKRAPRTVLGIVNEGNTCYINATLQLLWRIDLAARYVTGDPGPALPTIVDEVRGILAVHAQEGQEGTYGAYGLGHDFTTATTIGLRAALFHRGAAGPIGAQSDAGEALMKILEAFEHPVPGFSAGVQDHLTLALQAGDFAAKRPSKLHFITRVRTRFNLGAPSGPPTGKALWVDADSVATTYRCTSVLSLHLPDEPRPKPVEDVRGKTVKRSEKSMATDEQEADDDALEPVTLQQLLDRTFRVDHGGEGEIMSVETMDGHYPDAQALTEEIEIAAPPAHWLVQIERFVRGGLRKKQRKVKAADSLDGKPLRGFIVHLGATSTSGHYIAYIEHGGTWYCVNDDQVLEDPGDRAAMLEDAYILYYE